MKIAVIPARIGSKRILKKNIKNFCGKPMIAWAIDIAKQTKLFDHVIVSTDCDEITKIANKHGAETPFKRPKNLSDDITPTLPVIVHSIKQLLEMGWDIKDVCCIYPCTPFIQAEDIQDAFNILAINNNKFVYPVAEYAHPIQRAMRMKDNKKLEFISNKNETARTQDLETLYHDTGQFYWGSAETWINSNLLHSNGMGLKVPNWRVVDIDNNDDWIRAELLVQLIKDFKAMK